MPVLPFTHSSYWDWIKYMVFQVSDAETLFHIVCIIFSIGIFEKPVLSPKFNHLLFIKIYLYSSNQFFKGLKNTKICYFVSKDSKGVCWSILGGNWNDLPLCTLAFLHPSKFNLKQPTCPSWTLHPLPVTRIYQHLPRTISNIVYLPLPFSDLPSIPSTASICLELSATLSILHYHSETFRVFLPPSGSNGFFLDLSATLSISYSHSVTFRIFISTSLCLELSATLRIFHCHSDTFR